MEYLDRIAEGYEGAFGESFQQKIKMRLDWVCQRVQGHRVLDIGCSQGICEVLLARYGFHVTGVDIAEESIAYAKALVAKEPVEVQRNVDLIRADFMQGTFEAETYDTVLLTDILEHLENPELLLDKALQCLTIGGRVVVTVPFGINDYSDHKHTFYMADIYEMLSKWVEVDQIEFMDEWIGFCGKRGSSPGLVDTVDMALLKREEKAFFALERSLRDQLQSLSSMKSKFAYEQKKAEDLKRQLNSTTSLFEREQHLSGELLQQLDLIRSEFSLVRCRTEELQEQIAGLTADLQSEQQEKDKVAKSCEVYRMRVEYFRKLSEKRASQFGYEQKKAQRLSKELAEVTKKYDSTLTAKLKKAIKSIKRVVKPILFPIAQKIYHWAFRYPKLLKFFAKLNRIFRVFPDTNAVIFYGRPTPMTTVTITETMIRPEREGEGAELKAKKLSEMNVAMIVDEFTYNSFRYECNALPLEPSNWKAVFEENEIDFFFCESAWTGTDPDRRPWRGQVYASINFPKENRTVLLEILDYCKEHKIPTAFWNKEDPAHYEDRVHDFAATAKLFDHVFTTASECVERYKKDYGLKSVHLLMFATQPRMFNPIETCQREDAVIFAGSWYNQHPVRCQEMSSIFDGILERDIPLIIYNRQSENNDPNHQFPEKYIPYVRPRLRYDQMDAAYKGSNMALNINTVVDSDTMFARRVFELMSSNTFVLSNYSVGMEKLFGDTVAFVDGMNPIDVSNVDEKREVALHNVLSRHTYRHRFEQMVRDIGLPFTKSRDIVTLVYRVTSFDEAENCVRHFARVTYAEKQAVLFIDKECSSVTLRDIVTRFNQGKVWVLSEHYIQTYDEAPKLDCAYAAWTNSEMTPEFIEHAMLHWCYLPEKTGICEGELRYTIGKKNDTINVLVPYEEFSWNCGGGGNVYFI